MFGYVTASWKELDKDQQTRYGSVYCGICRDIHKQASGLARMTLSYDMAFLALLLMSLYEPEEKSGRNGCMIHPVSRRPWIDNEYVQYSADMNVALAYYKALDDAEDDGSIPGRFLASRLEPLMELIRQRWPRQCSTIGDCIAELTRLEKQNCTNPDETAGTFGRLMAELMVYHDDLWAQPLRQLGFHLGRFIYLVDAMLDYDADAKKGSYNPFLAMGAGRDPAAWEQYLVMDMARCTESYEKLPLVQDKAILDNILYSGVWVRYAEKNRREKPNGTGSV